MRLRWVVGDSSKSDRSRARKYVKLAVKRRFCERLRKDFGEIRANERGIS